MRKINFYLVFLLWDLLALGALIVTARIFNGNITYLVINPITILSLAEGQITPVIFLGLAMMWMAVHQKRPYLAGIGVLLLVTKYHYGGILAVYLWLHPELTWRQRFQILVIPIVVVLASFVVYGLWPLELIDTVSQNTPDSDSSIALWQWIGPVSLILWLPVLFLKLSYQKRFQLILVTGTLALPYFQYHDMNVIYLYTNYLGLTSWLLVLSVLVADNISLVVVVPLVIYFMMVGTEVRNYFQPKADTQDG